MDSSDFFKNLIDEAKLPVVFVGLEESSKIYIGNQQLGSRVSNRYVLRPFAYNDDTFRAILHHMDKFLPFRYLSGLASQGMWEYVHVATNGYLGYFKLLIKESVKIALEENMEVITMPILASAYESKLKMLADWSSYATNPFVSGFDLEEYLEKFQKNADRVDTTNGPKTNNRGRKV